ncbi:helix-turn-helix domain-containing protein [Metabacillus arenae]|uniref:Helix-turn-helix transcriptional regulator n=1 Tax=Metabacillus arenae TaxID=2771434 RepID=A0A926N9D9_9BACI|nr:helix-turn-helix transcriptional regulator [Metabacillus arenae]MBD1379154.1 helix-turn-helix transcriptional regulator [Metabacillus arenae]
MMGLEYLIFLRGMSRQDFSKKLGITRQQLNSWLNKGKAARPIPYKHIKSCSEFFNVPGVFISKLLTNEDKVKILNLEIQRLEAI